ncbi:MAG: hypothetical protein JNN06_03450 [Gemmobacter sp.]|uniref:TadE/TadG family type IV pilus assembly protein n=1 Tax=Gemmobacter sp. TaxID=1898957 RepID=UPI001A4D0B67|nr:hypothetical protein [Gemmobacter sp.]MBL8561314.1 hypothetical protein [Gemmobacter sp.]
MRTDLFRSLLSAPRRFLRDEDGNAVIESVFMLPLLIWAAFSMVVFWDGYHTMNKLQKASYTVSDVLSRWQGAALTAADAQGLQNMVAYLTNEGDQVPRLRMSSIVWVSARNRYEVQWSCSMDPAQLPAYTTTTLQAVKDNLPIAANGTTQLLIETEMDFQLFSRGQVIPMEFGEFIPVRPRFAAVAFSNPGACT